MDQSILAGRAQLCSYVLIGNRVRVKSSGLANARPPGNAKFASASPPGLVRREMSRSSPGGWGLGAAGID